MIMRPVQNSISKGNFVDLLIVEKLFEEIRNRDIDYCCPSGRADINAGGEGEIGIEFSISPNEMTRFTTVLSGLDFIQVVAPGKNGKSGRCRYMAVDEGTGKAVNIDVYEKVPGRKAPLTEILRPLVRKIDYWLCRAGLKRQRKNRLAPYGKIIAFLGGDGSGKTSNIKEFEDWFGKYLQVRVLHIGKPTKGPLWYGSLVILKLRKILLRIRSDNFHESIKHLHVARYRLKAFRKAITLRSKGVLVCLDRFPLPGMTYMEAPQIRRLTGGGGIFDRLARWEEQYHAAIRGADEMFVLILDHATATKRRPEDNPDELVRRYGDILQRDWPVGYAHLIDAAQPFDAVVSKIRKIAWNSLNKRAKVVEIIGPAGSGKTSLAKKLSTASNSLLTSVSWHDGKSALVKVVFRRLFQIASLAIKKVPMEAIKELVGLETELDIMEKHKKWHVLPCRNLVLEIGPVFKVAKILMEGEVRDPELIRRMCRKIADIVDLLVWIDAPNDILQARINSREKRHIMKDQASESIQEFLENYRKAFSSVISESGEGFPVVRFDSSIMSVDELSDTVRGFL
jgi:thymidylate kinase